MVFCPACHFEKIIEIPETTADFFALRVFDGQSRNVTLNHCPSCGFAWYTPRPTEEQLTRLYQGYRNATYQRQRQSCEEWYTPEINKLIGTNPVERKNRAAALTALLKRFSPPEAPKTVLDYGGDKGQHIPAMFDKAQRFVYDISHATPVDGVIALPDFTAVAQRRYDFIMCCHVLEHVCDPVLMIRTLRDLLTENGRLYIELPFDSPFHAHFSDKLQFLFNPYFPLRTLVRTFLKKRRARGVKPMHEHINFFTPDAINAMVQNENLSVLCNQTKVIPCDWCNTRIIGLLAKKA